MLQPVNFAICLILDSHNCILLYSIFVNPILYKTLWHWLMRVCDVYNRWYVMFENLLCLVSYFVKFGWQRTQYLILWLVILFSPIESRIVTLSTNMWQTRKCFLFLNILFTKWWFISFIPLWASRYILIELIYWWYIYFC